MERRTSHHGKSPRASHPEPEARAADPAGGTGTVLGRSVDREAAAGVRVVGVGASAGGAEAFAELFAALPSRTGLAFVVIQHLDASHGSMLATMLQKSTTLPVQQAEHGTTVEADHIYVIPPDRELSIRGGVLHLKARPAKVPHRPIDRFFVSLAHEQSGRAIGVVLSGNDSDGSAGLQAIRDAAGITFAQDASAHFGVMPRAAAAIADFVLRPSDIATQIVRIAAGGNGAGADVEGERFEGVLRLVRERFGVDFSPYKKPSIHRRILRRMLLDGHATVEQYARVLSSNDERLETLHQDLLIGVTAFFREPKQFETLRAAVFPALLREGRSDPLRIWVAGCSTGEEVYSVAMAILESVEGRDIPVTIFGTDINARALELARAGIYTERMLANVSPARRDRFFTPVPGGFRVTKKVRELCVFAKHDLTRDPPYSNIDLLTCCNVLIYFGTDLQQRALSAMHYALAPNGFLMLGNAESLRSSALFVSDGPKAPFYRKIGNPRQAVTSFGMQRDPSPRASSSSTPRELSAARLAESAAELFLADHLAPCGVLVNEASDIVRFRGNVDPFVRLIPGQANLNLFHLVRHPEVLAELRPAMRRAVQERVVVRAKDLVVVSDGEHRSISFEIVPFRPQAGPHLYWVLFGSERVESRAPAVTTPGVDEAGSLRHALNAAVEEREQLANEASAAAEEAQSSDEELRSANEELETAKEELQSANEELLTLNSELLNRNTSLIKMNDDLENVLSTIEIPMVFVGIDGCIRRFNAPAATLFQLNADSQGRPLSEARPVNHGGPDISHLVAEATAAHTASDIEVRDEHGRWRLVRIRPYRTSDGTVDGAILAVVDIDALKRSVLAAEKSARLSTLLAQAGALLAASLDYETTLESLTKLAVPDFADWCSVDLLADDGSIRHLAVSHANPFMRDLATKFQQLTWAGEADVSTRRHGTFRESILVSELNEGERSGNERDTRYAQLVGALGLKSLIRAPLQSRDRTFGTMTFSIADRTYTEDDLAFANELARHAAMAIDTALLFREAEAANRYLHALLGTVAHEIRTPLTTILGWTQLAAERPHSEGMGEQALEQIDQSAKLLKVFIDDLLDTERIKMRKLRIEKEEVDLRAITETAVEMMRGNAAAKEIGLIVDAGTAPAFFHGDRGRLLQVVWNLVSNAIKFTPTGGEIRVVLAVDEAAASLCVTDTGIGIDDATLPRVFDLFHQGHNAGERSAGLGLGLAIVKEVVTLHGGTVEVRSDGASKGSTFTVLLPFEQRQGSRRRGDNRREPVTA